jgi:hypothetical protein
MGRFHHKDTKSQSHKGLIYQLCVLRVFVVEAGAY